MGYNVLLVDSRGRYESAGTWRPYFCEVEDGFDTQKWLGEQPWCDGNVGMFGRSYVGFTQILPTPFRCPSVKARTEIREPNGHRRFILQYPIKTMNFQPKSNSFQVDTGPLLMPDLASNAPKAIDRLEMAHVAYNQLDWAEFIIRRPTPNTDDEGREVCRVLHYSEVREIPVRTVMLIPAYGAPDRSPSAKPGTGRFGGNAHRAVVGCPHPPPTVQFSCWERDHS